MTGKRWSVVLKEERTGAASGEWGGVTEVCVVQIHVV